MEGSSKANASWSRKKGKAQKMTLETYIDFLSSPKQFPLTINCLNQIISIHGFKKLFHVHRKQMRDAVETLDLIDPSRSTLASSISPCAPLTVEEIIRDLNLLQWQDCCITTIQTLNSSPEQQSHSVSKGKGNGKGSAQVAEPEQQSHPVTKDKDNRKRSTQVADIAEPLNPPSPQRSVLISKKKKKKNILEGGKTLEL